MKAIKKVSLPKIQEEKSSWMVTAVIVIGFIIMLAFGVNYISQEIENASKDYANAIDSIPNPYTETSSNVTGQSSEKDLIDLQIETFLVAHPELIGNGIQVVFKELKNSDEWDKGNFLKD